MDITKFMIKDEKETNTKKQKIIDYVNDMYCQKKITLTQHLMISNFIKNNCAITQVNKIMDIILKIKEANFKILLKNEFPYNLKPNRVIMKFIMSNTWTFSQEIAIINIINFLYSDKNTYGLYGFAGTGKTTVIAELIKFLLQENYVNSIAETAPTNKAVSVLIAKSKINEQDLKMKNKTLDLITIHKLLKYENDFDIEGKRIFVKNKKSQLSRYDVIIVDECSMISKKIIDDLYKDIKDNKNIKVIFVGDPAQLPPVSEEVSPLFLQNEYTPQECYTMQQVIRTKNKNIVGMCNEIRAWVMNEIKMPSLMKYKGPGVYIYKEQKTFIQKFLELKQVNSIILTWTNKRSQFYNKEIREKLFDKTNLEKYEIGDKLMLNDYYKIPEDKDNKNKHKFYTAEQVIIRDLEATIYNFTKFIYLASITALKITNYIHIEKKLLDTIDNINKYVNNNNRHNIWKLTINKILPNKISDQNHEILVIHDTAKEKIEEIKKYAHEQIIIFWILCKVSHKSSLEQIEKIILKPLWKEWNRVFVEPFALIDYGYSISIHKSEGSSFCNVFVDTDDVLNNRNINEAKRCLYTGCTRASDELHILK